MVEGDGKVCCKSTTFEMIRSNRGYGFSSGDHLQELCTGGPGHADDRRVVDSGPEAPLLGESSRGGVARV